MVNRYARRALGAVLGAALSLPVAADRVDSEGDFSNLNQRLIIRYADDGTARDMASEARNLSAHSGAQLQFERSLAVRNHHLFKLEQRIPQQGVAALLAALAKAPGVEHVEVDALMQAEAVVDDTHYPLQWSYFETTGGISAEAAWAEATGSGIIVAILDTGYTMHSDLLSNLLPGYDFIHDTAVANDGDGRDSDPIDPGDWLDRQECGRHNPSRPIPSSWHGTHVAGIVAAIANNGQGVAGVAYGASVVPVRVLGKCGGYVSDIADGIVWASGGRVMGVPDITNRAQVINMSLGGSGACSSTYAAAITIARDNGSTVITSAGNSNANASGFSPANCGGVITVAASDRQGNRAYYSNYGPTIDVSAPGGETNTVAADGIPSTLNDGTTVPGYENYVYYQGTSMAAPHVAGVAALLYQAQPGITPDEVEAALIATARPFPGSCSGGCGAGIISASLAIDYVKGAAGAPNTAPVADFTYSTTQGALTVVFTDISYDLDAGGSIVAWGWDFDDDGHTDSTLGPGLVNHTYPGPGNYTVSLTVTDDQGAKATSDPQIVTVDDGSGTPSITLAADDYKVRGVQHVDLSWTGAASTNVDIYRNSALIGTTDNDGVHTDNIGRKGGGSCVYRLCEEGADTCAEDVTVVF